MKENYKSQNYSPDYIDNSIKQYIKFTRIYPQFKCKLSPYSMQLLCSADPELFLDIFLGKSDDEFAIINNYDYFINVCRKIVDVGCFDVLEFYFSLFPHFERNYIYENKLCHAWLLKYYYKIADPIKWFLRNIFNF